MARQFVTTLGRIVQLQYSMNCLTPKTRPPLIEELQGEVEATCSENDAGSDGARRRSVFHAPDFLDSLESMQLNAYEKNKDMEKPEKKEKSNEKQLFRTISSPLMCFSMSSEDSSPEKIPAPLEVPYSLSTIFGSNPPAEVLSSPEVFSENPPNLIKSDIIIQDSFPDCASPLRATPPQTKKRKLPKSTPPQRPTSRRRISRADKEIIQQLDAILLEDTKMFSGVSFIFTGFRPSRAVSFQKQAKAQAFIRRNGGCILEGFEQIPSCTKMDRKKIKSTRKRFTSMYAAGLSGEVYVISDGFRRTIKCFLSLARGMRCVSVDWILECERLDDRIDHNAFSIAITEKESAALNRGNPVKKQVFEGLSILLLMSEEDDHINGWGSVCIAAGARVCRDMKCIGHIEHSLVIIADDKPTRAIRSVSRKHSIPVKTVNWLIKSLLQQKYELQ